MSQSRVVIAKLRKTMCIVVLVTGSILITGCSSSDLSVGQKLRQADGTEFGTIIQLEENHQFENGVTEPGALVDYGSRIPGTPPQWIPQRSVSRMVD